MKIDEFLTKQEELFAEYEKAKEAHPKPMKAKSNRTKSGHVQSHNPGQNPNCKYCKPLIDAVVAINEHDKAHLGMTRIEMTNTRNAVTFIRNVIKMMKESNEI